MGNQNQRQADQRKTGESTAGQSQADTKDERKEEKIRKVEEKEQKKKEKKAKKMIKNKRSKAEMDKIPAEIQALLYLDATDGNKEGQTIFSKLVNVNMVGSGLCQKAAITGRNGMIYAESDGLKLKEKDISAIAQTIHDPSPLAAQGMHLGKEDFHYTSSKPSCVYGKSKTDVDLLCMIIASKQLLLIGIYNYEKRDETEEMMTALQQYFTDQNL